MKRMHADLDYHGLVNQNAPFYTPENRSNYSGTCLSIPASYMEIAWPAR